MANSVDIVAYDDPLASIDWSGVALDCWWMPPDALSLSGVPAFEALPLATRRRLSQGEYVHLLQVGGWLEALFVERLAALAQRSDDLDVRASYLREIREEAGHSLMFVELIRRSGIPSTPLRAVRLRGGRALARCVAPGSALFWALVVAGEEIPNRLNRRIARSTEDATISAVVYRMAALHGRDETSHAAFAREQCKDATLRLSAWRRRASSALLAHAIGRFARLLHYPPREVYESAGLAPAVHWCAVARRNAVRRMLVHETAAPTLEFLRRIGWTV
jgi:predicted metal-dependent hydrolase